MELNHFKPAKILATSQTIYYMVSALAYSQWGILVKAEPLVALLVATSCVYCFTSGPKNKDIFFIMQIDKAEDVSTMEWFLSDYIEGYIRDLNDVLSRPVNRKTKSVSPFDLSLLNFGNNNWIPISQEHNFGFFTTVPIFSKKRPLFPTKNWF